MAFFAGWLLGRGKKGQSSSFEHSAGESNYESQRLDPFRVHIANEGWPTDSSGHQRKEVNYWVASTVVSIAAFIAACVAIYYANGAFEQARRQADAAEEGNRPWLKVAGLRDVRVQVTKESVQIAIDVNINNVGKDPAQNIEIVLDQPRLWTMEHYPPSYPKKFCEEYRRGPRLASGIVAFPGDNDFHLSVQRQRQMQDFKRSLDKEIEDTKKRSVVIVGTIEGALERLRTQFPLAAFHINGCVVYHFPQGSTKVPHSTSFVFTFGKAPAPQMAAANPQMYQPIDIRVPQELAFKDIKLLAVDTFDHTFAD